MEMSENYQIMVQFVLLSIIFQIKHCVMLCKLYHSKHMVVDFPISCT